MARTTPFSYDSTSSELNQLPKISSPSRARSSVRALVPRTSVAISVPVPLMRPSDELVGFTTSAPVCVLAAAGSRSSCLAPRFDVTFPDAPAKGPSIISLIAMSNCTPHCLNDSLIALVCLDANPRVDRKSPLRLMPFVNRARKCAVASQVIPGTRADRRLSSLRCDPGGDRHRGDPRNRRPRCGTGCTRSPSLSGRRAYCGCPICR